MGLDNDRLFGGVVARFGKRLPRTEHWVLHVPFDATAGLTPSQFRSVPERLGEWVARRAENLPLVQYGDRYGNPPPGDRVDGIPFRVSLHRWTVRGGGLGTRFAVTFAAPCDLEVARVVGLRTTCDAKFAKLAAWKRDANARTVLVLEDNNIALTNSQLIREALAAAVAGEPDAPDEIYLASTELADIWWGHVPAGRRGLLRRRRAPRRDRPSDAQSAHESSIGRRFATSRSRRAAGGLGKEIADQSEGRRQPFAQRVVAAGAEQSDVGSFHQSRHGQRGFRDRR